MVHFFIRANYFSYLCMLLDILSGSTTQDLINLHFVMEPHDQILGP